MEISPSKKERLVLGIFRVGGEINRRGIFIQSNLIALIFRVVLVAFESIFNEFLLSCGLFLFCDVDQINFDAVIKMSGTSLSRNLA